MEAEGREPEGQVQDSGTWIVRIGTFTAVGVFGIWMLSLWFFDQFSIDWATSGTIGDSYGAVNALFSGFAFVGIVVTLLMQREELKLQRQELKSTRGELKRTADAQEAFEFRMAEQVEMARLSAILSAHATLFAKERSTGSLDREATIKTYLKELEDMIPMAKRVQEAAEKLARVKADEQERQMSELLNSDIRRKMGI